MSRRKFTKEFKTAAVNSVIRGTPVEDVSRACHVDPAILRRWQKEFNQFGDRAFGGYGKSRHTRAEPRSRSVVLHLSPDELDAVKMARCAAGFQNLAEFARSWIFRPAVEPPLTQVEILIEELTIVMTQLTQTLTKKRLII